MSTSSRVEARAGVEPTYTDLQSPGEAGAQGALAGSKSRAARFARIGSAILVALSPILLAACGGADGPLSSAQAQVAAQIEVAHLHGVLRPDANGQWLIQDDADHASIGILPTVGYDETRNQLIVNFDRRYTHAGTVQATPDDDFTKRGIRIGCNLGVTATLCTVTVKDQEIDPRRIWDYAPVGAGNFWISVTMVNKPV